MLPRANPNRMYIRRRACDEKQKMTRDILKEGIPKEVVILAAAGITELILCIMAMPMMME